MTTTNQTRREPFQKRLPGKIRRNDRRDAIARKSAFLIDGLTTRVH